MGSRRSLLRTGGLVAVGTLGGLIALPSPPDATPSDRTVEAAALPDAVAEWTDDAIARETQTPIARYQYRATATNSDRTDRDGFVATSPINVVLVPDAETDATGLERRRTATALAYLAALVGLFGVSYAGANVSVDDAVLDTLSTGFDHVSSVLIVAVTVTVTIAPFAYAIRNGGPGLAFAIPLVPIALGDLAAGQYVLSVDTAVALTTGAAASAVALYAADVRTAGSLRPWRTADGPAIPRLLAVTVLTVVAAFGIVRFVAVVPPRSLERYAPFAALWLVSLGIVGSYWTSRLRTTVAMRADRNRADS